jgi:hypothetical protein
MVINHFNIVGVAINPPETDPPLLVDSDTELSGPITGKLLQTIVGRDSKILENPGIVQHPELPPSPILDIRWQTLSLLAAPDLSSRL